MILLYIFLSFTYVLTLAEKLTPILPGDPYNVVGDIEKRQLGRCTYLYAWLAIPQGSHQDIYAHYSACSRLELSFLKAAREARSPESDFKINVVDEYNRINKDYTGQLVDLETLDALLQTVKVTNGVQSSPPLTTKDRIFYLADRLGQYTMLAMLRPGRLPKIEIVPPPSEKTHIFPQNVLCYRKSCEAVAKSESNASPASPSMASRSSNTSMEYIILLAEAKQENRRLYIQLIIYRVVFALAAFLCIILAIVTLILCFRNQRAGSKRTKKISKLEASYHSAPPYNSLNSASKINSPGIYTDSVAYPNNTALVLGDTSSLQNTAISSNLSGCELLAANGLNGAHFSYQPIYAADGSGGIKPLGQNRMYGSGAQNFFPIVTGFDRSASPASEGYRTGSLDRRSDAASEKIRRRTPIQLIALPQGAEAPPTANYIALTQPLSQYPQPSFKPPQSSENVQTMASHGSAGTVIRKLPSDMNFRASLNGESTSSGVAMS